jgi:hypothetical protein
MAFRTVLLRVMLWSLGIAAGVGAVAMLFFGEELIWRIVSTAAITGASAGGLLVFSFLSEREKSRSVGLLGMAIIAVEFLLGLLMTWTVDTGFPYSEEIGGTMASIAGSTMTAMICLRAREHPRMRAAGNLGTFLSATVLTLLIAAVWSPHHWRLDGTSVGEQFAQSGGILAALSPIAVVSAVGIGFDRRHWRWAGVLAAAMAYAMALAGIWGRIEGGHAFEITVTAGMVVALANIVFLCPLTRKQEPVRLGVLACAALCAVFTDVVIVSETSRRFDLLSRLAGATGILTACGCLALAVFAILNRRSKVIVAAGEIREYVMVCPACGKKGTIPAGDARCGRCGLGIQTRFNAPGCPACGTLPDAPAADGGPRPADRSVPE